MRCLVLVILAAGCTLGASTDSSLIAAGEDFLVEGERDATLPPPTDITLEGPDFVTVSQPFELTVPDALSEETVYIISAGGEGEGPCPRPLGGYCVDLTRPVTFAGIAPTDGAGRAVSEQIAPRFPGATGCFQAVIPRGPSGIYSAISNVQCIDFCADEDTDGDGICDEYDICFGADETDSDGDGLCDASDPCPLDAEDTDSDGDGVCDVLDPCPSDNPDDTDSDGICDSDDICPEDPLDDCTCVPSGSRVAFNTLVAADPTGCYDGNPCERDDYSFSPSESRMFDAYGTDLVCGGTTGCVSHVGITTYSSSGNCQGRWEVYCDGLYLGDIETVGRSCTGSAMTNGCQVDFEPVECSQITLRSTPSVSGEPRACCGLGGPDSSIGSVSAW